MRIEISLQANFIPISDKKKGKPAGPNSDHERAADQLEKLDAISLMKTGRSTRRETGGPKLTAEVDVITNEQQINSKNLTRYHL